MENRLKVGDRIYRIHERITEVYPIDTIIGNVAFSGKNEFKIEYEDNGKVAGSRVTLYGFITPSYYIETPELKHEYKMQKIKAEISKINVDKLSDLQLIKIANIINEVE